ncbi:substrate-binding protein [Rhodopila sp.]|uniref:substrate-binding protein n=1 Tax=Rhodopila sp. TaxID=2480087 RepID=UPI003D1522B5
MDQWTDAWTVSRRGMLRTGLGLAGGLALAGRAGAADAPVGTFPAGVGADSVMIGITTPLTGPYSADGKDEQLGYELAISEINAGGPITRKWGLQGKGVLGKTLRYKIADSQTKPNVAVQAQTGFIQNDKAIMITGSVSSATAVALEELAQRDKVLNMVGASGSNDTTGKDCQRYGFRSQPSAYMACKALAPVVAKALGKDLKAAYLVPDYTYGHSVFDSFSTFAKQHGWSVATQQLVPLGTNDYSSALLNIANSGAQVFVNVAFGADAVASTKQAKQFGVLQKMKLVVPNISSFQAKEVGAELMQGVYGTFDFWWTLEDHYPLAKDFVRAFVQAHKYHPRWGAHIAYMQTMIWAVSVQRAKTFSPVEVIKALEASKADPYETTLGKVYYRAEDHQLVRPVPVVRGKAPSAMQNPDDFYEVVEVVPGEQVMSAPDAFGCHLGPYS